MGQNLASIYMMYSFRFMIIILLQQLLATLLSCTNILIQWISLSYTHDFSWFFIYIYIYIYSIVQLLCNKVIIYKLFEIIVQIFKKFPNIQLLNFFFLSIRNYLQLFSKSVPNGLNILRKMKIIFQKIKNKNQNKIQQFFFYKNTKIIDIYINKTLSFKWKGALKVYIGNSVLKMKMFFYFRKQKKCKYFIKSKISYFRNKK